MGTSASASYRAALTSLYELQFHGIKLGLTNTRGLLRSIGDPQRRFRVIHIAGTNGKGSTAAMLAAILTESGFRTALYTSPHLVDFRERMRIDGREIPERDVVRWTRRLMPKVRRRQATFFEAVTAMAFGWFADEGADIAVVETGLGGRLDATNVVTPIQTIITSIGLEHTAILGSTLSAIAREKAGIIKPRVPCVIGHLPVTVEKVVRRIARDRGSKVSSSSSHRIRVRRESLEGSVLDAHGPSGIWEELTLDLPGRFQLQNLSTALTSVAALRQEGMPIPDASVRRGLASIRQRIGLRGRWTVIRQHPTTVIDVAHNPAAIHALCDTIRRMRWKPTVVVVGVAADKDIRAIARVLRGTVQKIVAVAARTHRSRPAEETAEEFRRQGFLVLVGRSVADGVRLAMTIAGRSGRVLITGSHFVSGEAIAHLERRPYLTISQ